MKLLKTIGNLGYGSRRTVQAMFDNGRICDASGTVLHAKSNCELTQLLLDGVRIDPPPGVVLMLHKPCGYTCSTRDPNQVVYDLLPARFRLRNPIIAPVGRLDRPTSGLLLLTDDGQLQHRITAPKTHLPKSYIADLAQPLRGDEVAVFASGTLMLDGEATPLRPANLIRIDEKKVRVVITEGRYHQVRRMFAALGNHVESLHREQIGQLSLGDLPLGAWRVLSAQELALVFAVQNSSDLEH
jgi:16S rRNA pseudouridine516 synthase